MLRRLLCSDSSRLPLRQTANLENSFSGKTQNMMCLLKARVEFSAGPYKVIGLEASTPMPNIQAM